MRSSARVVSSVRFFPVPSPGLAGVDFVMAALRLPVSDHGRSPMVEKQPVQPLVPWCAGKPRSNGLRHRGSTSSPQGLPGRSLHLALVTSARPAASGAGAPALATAFDARAALIRGLVAHRT